MIFRSMDRVSLYLFVLFTTVGFASASVQFFITAPDVFHLNQTEKVIVLVMNTPANRPVEVSLYLENENRNGQFSRKSVHVTPGEPKEVAMTLNSGDFEDSNLKVNYVHLVAVSSTQQPSFNKSTKVMVSKNTHRVLVQLDKPIYTPRQEVHFRVYTMDLDLKPLQMPLTVDIINPQSIIMVTYDPSDAAFFSGNYTSNGILSASYWFSALPVLGKWKVKVNYGYKHFPIEIDPTELNLMQQVSEVEFHVEEYTLPTFELKIDCDEVILPSHQYNGVKVEISASYLFGEMSSKSQDDEHEQKVQFDAVAGIAFIRTGLLTKNVDLIYFHNTSVNLNTKVSGSDSPVTEATIPIAPLFTDMEYQFSDLVDRRLLIEVTVEDPNLGIRNTQIQTKAIFSTHTYHIDLSQTPKYFKPGKFTVMIKTRYPNGSTKRRARLTITRKARSADNPWFELNRANPNEVSTDDDGYLQYTFKLPGNCTEVQIEVKGKSPQSRTGSFHTGSGETTPYASLTVKKYQSPTNSFVHIHISETAHPKPGDLLFVDVYLTCGENLDHPKNYFYMVLGRGKILKSGSRTTQSSENGVNVLYIPVTEEMAPSARLLVYFMQENDRRNHEVIADALWFKVERKCAHKDFDGNFIDVALGTNSQQYEPSEEIKLTLRANAESDVALLAVDKAVYQLNNDNILTPQTVLDLLQSLDTGCSPGGGENNIHVFQGAGVTSINNLGMNIEERRSEECKETFSRNKRSVGDSVLSLEECCELGKIQASEGKRKSSCIAYSVSRTENTAQCKNKGGRFTTGGRVMVQSSTVAVKGMLIKILECCVEYLTLQDFAVDNVYDRGRGTIGTGNFDKEQDNSDNWEDTSSDINFAEYDGVAARKKFPESFLFQTVHMGADENKEVGVSLPDSITTWVFQGVAVHKDQGICVAQRHYVNTFKKLFIKLNMPATAVKGEQVVVKATFYNYKDDPALARAYLFVDEGICARGRPHDRLELGYIQASSTKTHSWPILPLKPGSFNITVVLTIPNRVVDKVEKWLLVKPPGEIRNVSIPIFLDPSGKSSGYLDPSTDSDSLKPYINTQIQSEPPKQTVTMNVSAMYKTLAENAVPGTAVCSLKVEGHLLAPIVDKLINEEGLDSMWMIPNSWDCGEQSISKVAPNVMAALYLKHTNKLNGTLKAKAQKLIKASFEQELKYRLPDGSFSFWRNDKENGKSTWLTAFVVKLMGIAAEEFDVMLRFENNDIGKDTVICEAVDWLLKQQKHGGYFHDPFDIRSVKARFTGGMRNGRSLSAFVLIALHQAKNTIKDQCKKNIAEQLHRGINYLERKVATLRRSNADPFMVAIVTYALTLYNSLEKYNANAALRARMIFDEDTNTRYLPGNSNRHSRSYKKSAVTVTQTAYALLTQVKLNENNYMFPMVTWLLSQRNSFGAFKSTHDTVLSLEALTMYKINSDAITTNLQCDIKFEGQAQPIESYTLKNDVHQVNKERFLHPKEFDHRNLVIETSGDGKAQAFLTIQYYSMPQNFRAPTVCPDFFLEITYTASQDSREHTVQVCVKNLQQMETSMGMIEIGLVTAQKVKPGSVKNIPKQLQAVEKLRHSKTTDSSLILYFDKIPRSVNQCVTIETIEKSKVQNSKPAAVTVYDYYEPSIRCTKFYGGTELSDQNEGILRQSCDRAGQCSCLEY